LVWYKGTLYNSSRNHPPPLKQLSDMDDAAGVIQLHRDVYVVTCDIAMN
jgi:hypothetical protein